MQNFFTCFRFNFKITDVWSRIQLKQQQMRQLVRSSNSTVKVNIDAKVFFILTSCLDLNKAHAFFVLEASTPCVSVFSPIEVTSPSTCYSQVFEMSWNEDKQEFFRKCLKICCPSLIRISRILVTLSGRLRIARFGPDSAVRLAQQFAKFCATSPSCIFEFCSKCNIELTTTNFTQLLKHKN